MNWSSLEGAYKSVHESWALTNPIGVMDFVLKARAEVYGGVAPNYRASIGRVLRDLHSREVRLPTGWADRYAHHLPRSLSLEFKPPSPRVVGLAVLPPDGLFQYTTKALVVPLHALPSERWSVQPGLPFTVDRLRRHFEALLDASQAREVVLHERFAWAVSSPLNSVALHGSSMDVAAVLSLIDRANGGERPEFAGACALVSPAAEGTFECVRAESLKLDAFVREYDRGALLIHHADHPPDPSHARRFDHCVPVRRWHDLFTWLDERDLLRVLYEERPLHHDEVRRIDAEVNRCIGSSYSFRRACDLVDHAERCGFEKSVPLSVRLQLLRRRVGAMACMGGAIAAAAAADKVRVVVMEQGDLATFDDLARSDTTYASQIFHLAEFDKIVELLNPWSDRIIREPRSFSIETRVAVFNTLARTLAQRLSDADGYRVARSYFDRSLDLQHRTQPDSCARTLNYVVTAALRCGVYSEARRGLDEAWKLLLPRDTLSRGYLLASEACLAMSEGRSWHTDEIEGANPRPSLPPFAVGVYYLATARQPQHDASERVSRLSRAMRYLEHETCAVEPAVLHFALRAIDLLRCSSDWTLHRSEWDRSLNAVHDFLHATPSLRSWFANVLPARDAEPSVEAAEALLSRMPYF